jgi:DNA-binding winged helix-turn-helix (wHTH) protein
MTVSQAIRVSLQLDLADIDQLKTLPGLAGAQVHIRHAPASLSLETLRIVALRQLGLSPAESRVFLKLTEQGFASKAELHAATADTGVAMTSIKIVDVTMYHLRKKLSSHGITIRTVHRQGYQLEQDSQDKVHDLLTGISAAPIAGQNHNELLEDAKK